MPEKAELFESVTPDRNQVKSEQPEKTDITAPTDPIDASESPEKPFNTCFSCRYFRNGCSGPNILLMSLERIYEFLHTVQVLYKIPNAQIARETGISLSSVKRIMSGSEKDPRVSTLQAISTYLVGDPNGKHACALYITEASHIKTEEALTAAQAELFDMTEKAERLKEQLREEKAGRAADHQKHQELQLQRYNFLKLKDRYIAITVALLASSLIANILTLIFA